MQSFLHQLFVPLGAYNYPNLEDNQQEKDFFNKFFPRELIEKITTETNNYATKCIEEKPDPKWKPTNVTSISSAVNPSNSLSLSLESQSIFSIKHVR
jgi:hypothetical protein